MQHKISCCIVTGGTSVGWTVVYDRLSSAIELAFKRAAVRSPEQGDLVVGQAVKLVGLTSRTDLNGADGLTLRFNEQTGRWLVRLADGDGKSLKPQNLKPLPRETEPHSPSGTKSVMTMHEVAAQGACEDDRDTGMAQTDGARPGEPSQSEPSPSHGGPCVLVFWGDAEWSRVQLLGEIARGHWGMCRASVADLITPFSARRAGLEGRLVYAPKSEMSETLGRSVGAAMDAVRQHLAMSRGAGGAQATGIEPISSADPGAAVMAEAVAAAQAAEAVVVEQEEAEAEADVETEAEDEAGGYEDDTEDSDEDESEDEDDKGYRSDVEESADDGCGPDVPASEDDGFATAN